MKTTRMKTIVIATMVLTAARGASAQDRRVVPGSGQSARRVALVVGNAAYSANPLRNPVNDAQALAASLRGPRLSGPMAPDLPVLYGERTAAASVTIPLAALKRPSESRARAAELQ